MPTILQFFNHIPREGNYRENSKNISIRFVWNRKPRLKKQLKIRRVFNMRTMDFIPNCNVEFLIFPCYLFNL